jgi:hypothetical protein
MSSKEARPPQLVGIRRTDLTIVSITFSGIPGDRDLTFMTDALEALGYEVSIDRDFPNAAKPGHPEYSDVVLRPDVDDDSKYRRRGTEDTGPEAPLKLNDSAQGDQTIETECIAGCLPRGRVTRKVVCPGH